MVRLTDKQVHVMSQLAGYVNAPSVRQLADNLERSKYRGAHWSYDQVYAQLERVVKRGLVDKLEGQAGERAHRYRLNEAGVSALSERAAGSPD